MNRFVFGLRNIFDKLAKSLDNPCLLGFYTQTYILSWLENVTPDIYIVSYPKCGRTWLRILLQKYCELCGLENSKFKDKSLQKLPNGQILKFEHDKGTWVPAPCTIEQLIYNIERFSGKKVVFLARDPRDVLVSSWYHLRFRENIYKGSLSEFIRDDLVGIKKLVSFMNMWIENSHIPEDFMLLTYEDMHNDPLNSFERFLSFSGLDIDHRTLQTAIEASTFQKMKNMELNGVMNEPWMKPGSRKSENSLKIRKGKVGGYKKEMSLDDIKYVDDIINNRLSSKFPYIQS